MQWAASITETTKQTVDDDPARFVVTYEVTLVAGTVCRLGVVSMTNLSLCPDIRDVNLEIDGQTVCLDIQLH